MPALKILALLELMHCFGAAASGPPFRQTRAGLASPHRRHPCYASCCGCRPPAGSLGVLGVTDSNTWQQRLFARYYYDRPGWRNGTWQFQDRCREYLHGATRPLILELGCGPTNANTGFLAELGKVHGADVDPAAADNRHIEQFRLLSDSPLDYPEESFDACVSFWTAEHVEYPERHLAMAYRALKPGGCYLFMTPNLFHYVSLVSRFTPHAFHLVTANRLRALPGNTHDPYPTFYRMNTGGRIRKAAVEAGFKVELIQHVEVEPNYGRSSIALFYLFMAYERVVNRWNALAGLRHTLIVALRKPLPRQPA